MIIALHSIGPPGRSGSADGVELPVERFTIEDNERAGTGIEQGEGKEGVHSVMAIRVA